MNASTKDRGGKKKKKNIQIHAYLIPFNSHNPFLHCPFVEKSIKYDQQNEGEKRRWKKAKKKAKMVVEPNVSLQRVQLNYIRILAVFFIERDR